MGSRFALVLAVVGVTLAAITASGCGGPSAAEKQAKAAAGAHAAHLAAYRKCKTQVGPFLSALEDLNSRLDVGLSFSDYGTRVGDVRVAHDAAPFDELGAACLSVVAVPAEAAMNAYVKAYNKWNNCFNDDYCTTDSISPELQAPWGTATGKIERAQAGLEQIRTGVAPVGT